MLHKTLPVRPCPPCSLGRNTRLVQSPQAVLKNLDGVRRNLKLEAGPAKKLANILATTAASLMLSSASASFGYELIRLPASADPEVFAAQKTMVEAWNIVGESFVDEGFNGKNWDEELKEHMMAAYSSNDAASAYSEISKMLSVLGDPYTRIVDPEDYANFRVSSDGELQGVGLLIANEPVEGHLMVLAPIKGSPADRAGVLPGDEVLSINDEPMMGRTGEQAAKLLRGQGGTEVRVKFARRSEQIPGVPGRPEPAPSVQYREVSLKRERVQLSPLYYTAINDGDDTLGYIRLVNFSSNAAAEMHDAIMDLESQGATAYILDLRSNPGGLVRAGVDVARLWLDGSPTVFTISGRADEPVQAVRLDEGAKALTDDPLVVLVNEGSASASEILSGALHDNHRATILGNTPTYGKGKIQSVFELSDGSALFVTVAKYKTPAGSDIDTKGIRPDKACSVGDLALTAISSPSMLEAPSLVAPPLPPPIKKTSADEDTGSRKYDNNLASASTVAGRLTPKFFNPSTLTEELGGDQCVLAAERLLHHDRPLDEELLAATAEGQ